MAALTSVPFVVLFACSWIFVLCEGTQELKVKVKPGEDATLQCRSERGADITAIEWSRTDLKSSLYVFYFRGGKTIENNQHESFHGRVELRDPEKKNGDASVILKKVNINDTGTYECRVRERNSGRRKRDASKPTSTIQVTVTAGSVGLKVDLPVLLLLAVGGFMF